MRLQVMSFNFFREEEPSVASFPSGDPSAELARASIAQRHANRYVAAVRWIVAAAVFLAPLFFLPWTTGILETNKLVFLAALAGAGLLVWLLGVVTSGQMSFRRTPMDQGVLAVLVATAIAAAAAVARTQSVFGGPLGASESLTGVLALSILYFLAVNVFDDRGKMLVKALTLSGVMALAYGLLQICAAYVLPAAFAHSRAFNSIGSINALGVFAAILLPLFVKIRIAPARMPYLDAAKLGAVLALAILAILNWWVLWTVAIIGMLGVIAFDSVAGAARRGERPFRISRFLFPMAVIVLGVFLMMVGFNFTPVKKHLPLELGPSWNLSGQVIKGVMKENLLLGYGPENFSRAFDRYGASRLANSTLSNIQFLDGTSQAVNAVAQGGVVLALAFLWMLGTVGAAMRRAPKVLASDDNDGMSAGVFAALAAGIAGFALYPFNLVLASVWYVLLALAALAAWGSPRRTVDIEERPAFSVASSLGFIVGLLIVLTGGYFLATHYAADARYAGVLATRDVGTAPERLTSAIAWDSSDSRYYQSLSQALLDRLAQEVRDQIKSGDPDRAKRIQGDVSAAIEAARTATQADPSDSAAWANLGNVYGSLIGLVDGTDKLAESAYLKAAELRPGDPSFANRIGSLYLAEADFLRSVARGARGDATALNQRADVALVKAEDAFKHALEISQNFGMAIYNLGAVYDRQGKLGEAIKQIERIAPYNADDANLLFELGLLYYRADRKTEAFNALQRSVLVSKTNFANARWYLALIYEERKDLPSAIGQLEKILETNPDNATVLSKLDELRQGTTRIPPAKVIDQKPL